MCIRVIGVQSRDFQLYPLKEECVRRNEGPKEKQQPERWEETAQPVALKPSGSFEREGGPTALRVTVSPGDTIEYMDPHPRTEGNTLSFKSSRCLTLHPAHQGNSVPLNLRLHKFPLEEARNHCRLQASQGGSPLVSPPPAAQDSGVPGAAFQTRVVAVAVAVLLWVPLGGDRNSRRDR